MTTTTNEGSNIDGLIRELSKKLSALGANDAKGTASRPAAALIVADSARSGFISEDYAQEAFASYAKGAAAAAKDNPMVTARGNDDQKSAKQQVSKFRQFIKCGALPAVDGPVVLRETIEVVQELTNGGTKTQSVFDSMLSVARAQIKQPEQQLTRDEISALVIKDEAVEKTEIDKLIEVYKRAHKLSATLPGNVPLENAVQDLRDAIVEAGGDVPPLTDEEKREAEAMAFLRSRGLVPVRMLPGADIDAA